MDTQTVLNAVPEILTQLAGFLIVFWILKKYAFGTLLGIIDERRNSIADGFKEIEDRKSGIENLEKEYRAKLQNIEQEGRSRIQAAVEEGNRVAQDIKRKASSDSLNQLERAKAEIHREVEKSREVLRRQMVEISMHVAEKVIRKNLTDKDNERFVKTILQETEREAHKP